MPCTSLGADLASARTSEIERQKWFKDPREIHTRDQLHQLPLVDESVTWSHTNYSYEWQRNGVPVARPLIRGGLIFNEKSQWWERNGSSWQAEKKSRGGLQTTIDLRHLGVVIQPHASRFFGKAKTLLGRSKPLEQRIATLKDDLRGVPTIVSEVLTPEDVAQKTFDLTARTHILYTQKRPFSLLKALMRKSCRHPSTCHLHPHINVDIPEDVGFPLVEEPEKLKAAQSAFMLRACQHAGHEHLSHDEDPCFSDAEGASVNVPNQEDVIRRVSEPGFTGPQASELEKIWQQEEEQERQKEMLILSNPRRKENRPPSVSAQTLFHNAAKSLQRQSATPELHGEHIHSLDTRPANALNLRGGSGGRRYSGQPSSWRIKERFTGIRREPVRVIHTESDEHNGRRSTRIRQIHHRFMHAEEAGMSEGDWAAVPVLSPDDIEHLLNANEPPQERAQAYRSHHLERTEAEAASASGRQGPKRTHYNEYGIRQEAEHVGTISDEARRRIGRFGRGSPTSSSSDASSDSFGSFEVIRVMNTQREQGSSPDEIYGRSQPEHYWGKRTGDNLSTQGEWAQWDGRTHVSSAAVLTRSPGGRNGQCEPYFIDREPGLRRGSEGGRRW